MKNSFENLSWAPIDIDLIDVNLLDKDDMDWLNSYHSKVYEKISEYLNEYERTWLKKATSAL